MEEIQSDFGKGFAYNLGLFLAHSDQDMSQIEAFLQDYSMWFPTTADHLFDLCVELENLGEELSKRTSYFRKFCLSRRIIMDDEIIVTKEDRIWAINEAKQLLLI